MRFSDLTGIKILGRSLPGDGSLGRSLRGGKPNIPGKKPKDGDGDGFTVGVDGIDNVPVPKVPDPVDSLGDRKKFEDLKVLNDRDFDVAVEIFKKHKKKLDEDPDYDFWRGVDDSISKEIAHLEPGSAKAKEKIADLENQISIFEEESVIPKWRKPTGKMERRKNISDEDFELAQRLYRDHKLLAELDPEYDFWDGVEDELAKERDRIGQDRWEIVWDQVHEFKYNNVGDPETNAMMQEIWARDLIDQFREMNQEWREDRERRGLDQESDEDMMDALARALDESNYNDMSDDQLMREMKDETERLMIAEEGKKLKEQMERKRRKKTGKNRPKNTPPV